MRTPSLRRRVLAGALGVFLLVVVALETFVALSLRDQLNDALDDVLAARVQVAREVADSVPADEIADQLATLGVPAVVTAPGGERTQIEPSAPRYAPAPPVPTTAVLAGSFVSETVELPDGGTIDVLASRAGVDTTMRRVRLLMAAGTVVAVVLAWLLLRAATRTAMAPLGEIAAAARRTAGGQTGERLRPDDPRTELGKVAVAYDEMLDALEDAVERARDEEERTRRFLDDAAHQLRTPIAATRASVEGMLSTADPAARDRLMANLVRETSRSARVLRDLLTMARLDTGRPPRSADLDLAAVCRDEVERTRSLAPDLDVVLHAPGDGAVVRAEATAIQESIANLLDNARRHADTRVEVAVRETPDGWAVAVLDDGPGVEPEARELVFERFATLDGMGGTGLGLPIARTIARAHGGDLTCDDEGFVLRLPRDGQDDPAPPAPQAPAGVRPPGSPRDA